MAVRDWWRRIMDRRRTPRKSYLNQFTPGTPIHSTTSQVAVTLKDLEVSLNDKHESQSGNTATICTTLGKSPATLSPIKLSEQKKKQIKRKLKRMSRAASMWLDGKPLTRSKSNSALLDDPKRQAVMMPSSRVASKTQLAISKEDYNNSNEENNFNLISLSPSSEDEDEHNDRRQGVMDEKQAMLSARFIAVPWTESANAHVHKREAAHRHFFSPSNYPNNYLRTAKYSLFTFVPKNLYEQFHRVANIYFLLLIVLQFIPVINNFSPGLACIPLAFILLVTAIKDGMEDWKRHQADLAVNYASALRLLRPSNVDSSSKPEERVTLSEQKTKNWVSLLGRGAEQEMWVALTQGANDMEKEKNDQAPQITQSANSHWTACSWCELAVGDLVLLSKDEVIPADILVLSTSESEGQCYVETKNLDGETNLKVKLAPQQTRWLSTDPNDVILFRALLHVDQPNNQLYTFHGTMRITKDNHHVEEFDDPVNDSGLLFNNIEDDESSVIVLGISNLLLRGCVLRNTEWVVGMVVYTGVETKIVQNTGVTPSKRSRIERQMNPQIIMSFAVLVVLCLVCACVQGSMVNGPISRAPFWSASFGAKAFGSGLFTGFITFWSCLLLFQTLVPISLYITVEICKTVQAYLIWADAKMWNEQTGKRCLPRAWNLADDLGHIDYLFSDKTGTLTENVMEFRQASIGGKLYSGQNEPAEVLRTIANKWGTSYRANAIMDQGREEESLTFPDLQLIKDAEEPIVELFFTIVCCCNTVLVTMENNDHGPLSYTAQSPDEAALVNTANALGFSLRARNPEELVLNFHGTKHAYRLLHTIEFTSQRRRMSVLVERCSDQSIWLFCKGADSALEELLGRDEQGYHEQTLHHVQHFAEQGFRTLCLAAKQIHQQEYSRWTGAMREANLHGNDKLIESLCLELEHGLSLIGATAIEDCLQKGVPECIQELKQAGMHVWVLTGDRLETAINIGYSCNLLTPGTDVTIVKTLEDVDRVLLTAEEPLEQQPQQSISFLNRVISSATRSSLSSNRISAFSVKGDPNMQLVITGVALEAALKDERSRRRFVAASRLARAVICCRVSPRQKAQVVCCMQTYLDALCLAIGDGANDVAMLQAANVGVGIAGEEGMQAVMASDYAISRFADLRRLLLVHGRWSYLRTSNATLAVFYKNIAFVGVQVWYQFFCAFTAQYSYDYVYMLFYNAVFSILPVLAIGILDRDLEAEEALTWPTLYRAEERYTLALFGVTCLDAVWQTLVVHFSVLVAYRDTVQEGVQAIGTYGSDSLLTVGNLTAFSVVIAVNATILWMGHCWTFWTVLSSAASIGLLFAFVLAYMAIDGVAGSLWGSWTMFASPRAYLTVIIALTLALLPRVTWLYVKRTFFPSALDHVISMKIGQRNRADVERDMERSMESSTSDLMMTVEQKKSRSTSSSSSLFNVKKRLLEVVIDGKSNGAMVSVLEKDMTRESRIDTRKDM